MALRITHNGRLVLTTAQAAERYGLTPGTMRSTIKRLGLPAADSIDERTPVYYAKELDAAMKARPGRGANLRRSSDPLGGTGRSDSAA